MITWKIQKVWNSCSKNCNQRTSSNSSFCPEMKIRRFNSDSTLYIRWCYIRAWNQHSKNVTDMKFCSSTSLYPFFQFEFLDSTQNKKFCSSKLFERRIFMWRSLNFAPLSLNHWFAEFQRVNWSKILCPGNSNSLATKSYLLILP